MSRKIPNFKIWGEPPLRPPSDEQVLHCRKIARRTALANPVEENNGQFSTATHARDQGLLVKSMQKSMDWGGCNLQMALWRCKDADVARVVDVHWSASDVGPATCFARFSFVRVFSDSFVCFRIDATLFLCAGGIVTWHHQPAHHWQPAATADRCAWLSLRDRCRRRCR